MDELPPGFNPFKDKLTERELDEVEAAVTGRKRADYDDVIERVIARLGYDPNSRTQLILRTETIVKKDDLRTLLALVTPKVEREEVRAMCERLRERARWQRENRGSMMDYGRPDPELEEAAALFERLTG